MGGSQHLLKYPKSMKAAGKVYTYLVKGVSILGLDDLSYRPMTESLISIYM